MTEGTTYGSREGGGWGGEGSSGERDKWIFFSKSEKEKKKNIGEGGWRGGLGVSEFFNELTKNPHLLKKIFFFFFFFLRGGGGVVSECN